MKKVIVLPLLLMASGLSFLFHSCETDLSKIDTKPAESALKVMSSFSDIILMVDDGLTPDSVKGGMRLMDKEYTETISGDYPDKLYTWDFGPDGDYQGIIKLLLSDDYANEGAIVQVSFEDFVAKGKPVSGTITFENKGKNGDNKDEYGFVLNAAQSGASILTADWVLQRTEGGDTPDQADDIFTIMQNGLNGATGTTEEGDNYTLTILEGLVLDLTCEHILTKGLFELVFKNSTLQADFGTGACDNLVKVNNGTVKADVFF